MEVIKPNWKPFFFSPIYILPLVVLHILYIIGIQLLVNRYNSDVAKIDLVRQNVTLDAPPSIFVFDEASVSSFLTWQYLPVAIASILGLFWEALDSTARRLEPFHQLSRDEGGHADNAMCLDYISMFSLAVPFSAFRKRHYPVAASSLLYTLSAAVVPALTGGMWSIEWASLSYSANKTEGTNYAAVVVNPSIAVATQVFHGIIVALGITIAVLFLRQNSGLYRDPQGIGGIASLISESDQSSSNTLRIFRQLPSYAHSTVVAKSLRGIPFQLRHLRVVNHDGSSRITYQLAALTHPAHMLPLSHMDCTFYRQRRDATGFWLTKRAAWIAEGFLWLCQAAVIGGIYTAAQIVGVGDRAQPTIAKMVLTLFYAIGGMMWQSIQRDLQLFEPWRRLTTNSGRSLYEGLVRSDVTGLGLVGSAALSIASRSLFTLWATFTVLMIHATTVFIPPLLELASAAGLVDYSNRPPILLGVLKETGLVLTGIVLHIIIFCNLLFLMASGRTRPFLPRRPTTIASQIVYLCRSDRLLADFAGVSMLSKTELARRLREVDRACVFGWTWWPRGQTWFIGVEEKGAHWMQFNFQNGVFQPST